MIKTASSQNVHVHVLTLKCNNFHCQLRHKQRSFTEEIYSSCITDKFNWPYKKPPSKAKIWALLSGGRY